MFVDITPFSDPGGTKVIGHHLGKKIFFQLQAVFGQKSIDWHSHLSGYASVLHNSLLIGFSTFKHNSQNTYSIQPH